MADDQLPIGDPIQLDEKMQAFVAGLVDSFFDVKKLQRVEVAMKNAHAEGATVAHAAQIQAAPALAERKGATFDQLKDTVGAVVAPLLAWMVGEMLGVELPAGDLQHPTRDPSNSSIGGKIADVAFRAFPDPSGELTPSDEPAKKMLGTLAHITLHSWATGIILEQIDSYTTWGGHVEAIAKLGEELVQGLGLSRLARVALRPLAHDLVATPMQWKINKAARPKLLSEATAMREFLRGRWDWADVAEELARLGWNEARQEALYNEARKFQSIDDLARLVGLGKIAIGDAVQTMRDQGYDEDTATNHFNTRKLDKEESAFNGAVSAAISAFVDRRIDESKLDEVLGAGVNSPLEHQLIVQAAQLHRDVNVKPLTSAEVKAAVLAGVLAVPDYREALARENRTDDAIDVLDLLLRIEAQKGTDAATHKQQLAEEKAAAAKARADAAAAKKAEIDAARQLKALGPIGELEHAVIVGLISIDRLVQVLAAQFAPDTVQIYVDDVTQKRAAYIAEQQRKADAAKRADNKGLNVGQLEQAVFDGVIPIDTLQTLLEQRGLAASDVHILVATVQAHKTALDAAKKKRAEADLRAANKKISLDKAETLVLLGHWPMTQYQQLVASLGFDDAAVAGLVDLLQTKIDARAAGKSVRDLIAAQSPAKGLTLEQLRKAVIAGDKTLDQFSAFLRSQKYTADAQAVLRDELAADVAAAAAARLRRLQGDTAGGAVVLPLTIVRKAARLGIITPGAYQDRLVAGGYADEDIALEMDLLIAEIAQTKGAQQSAQSAPASAAGKGLTLTQLADAVKRGTASIGEYQAAARANGLSDDAINTLTAGLEDALSVKAEAKSAHEQIAAALAGAGVTLTALEDSVRAGALTLVSLEGQLVGYGYSEAEAQLVGSLLEQELAAA